MKSLRLPLIILSILCVVFLLFAMQQFLGRTQEKSARTIAEKDLDEAKQALAKVQKDLDEQKKVKTDLETQLLDINGKFKSIQDKAEKLAAQIAEEKRAKEDALALVSDREQELQSLKASLESEKKDRDSLQDEYNKIKKDYVFLQGQLKAAHATNEDLAQQVEELQAGREVQLDKIVVKPGVEPAGKVLVVNKEFNFIVIAAGNNKGITQGVIFSVFRDGNLIGKAQVEKVYETMSAANIMPNSAEIKEGDLAKVM